MTAAPRQADAPAAPGVGLRPAAPGDLHVVTALLGERDGHALDPEHVRNALEGLDPSRLAGWIALVGDEPAGFTSLYVRDLRWGDRTIRAGYWAHLFVREKFRRLMVYPQLVLAMMRGIRPSGIDAIVTGTRRPHVAEGHVRLGFAPVGTLRVLFKPLRPFRLLLRHRGWGGGAWAATPGDALYGAWLASRRRGPGAGIALRDVGTADPAIAGVAGLLASAGAGRVSRPWTPDDLRRRLAGTIDGRAYTTIVAERAGSMAGVTIVRPAERSGVSLGVVMDVAADDDRVAAAILDEAERRLRAAGTDAVLLLDGLGPAASRMLRERGYRASSETYRMLVWPKTLVPPGSFAADLANWRFGFLDHDAF